METFNRATPCMVRLTTFQMRWVSQCLPKGGNEGQRRYSRQKAYVPLTLLVTLPARIVRRVRISRVHLAVALLGVHLVRGADGELARCDWALRLVVADGRKLRSNATRVVLRRRCLRSRVSGIAVDRLATVASHRRALTIFLGLASLVFLLLASLPFLANLLEL